LIGKNKVISEKGNKVMGLRVSTNIASLAAQRNLSKTSSDQSKLYESIASGKRITSAGDDAAGLSISENLRAQITSMRQAERNANDGVSLVQVAEGSLSEVSNIIIRLRELSIQAASDTVGDVERSFINQEVQSLKEEVDRISQVTNFNGQPLLSGTGGKKELEFQVGIRNNQDDRIVFNVHENDVRTRSLGIQNVNTRNINDARRSIDSLDQGLGKVNEARARLGAMQNKLHSTTNNLQVARENLANAHSQIADTDIAEATSQLIQQNILQAAGISILAQANAAPSAAMRLLA
jgi:flagellin